MSVEQAYDAIPHARTPYDPKQSREPKADTKYLDHLFFVTDMALVLRVETFAHFKNLNPHVLKKYHKDIENLISSFELIETPPHLMQVQTAVIEAIRDQQNFFQDWSMAAGTPQYLELSRIYKSHPLVKSSHQKLLQAYAELKRIYPQETPHNTQAFFDHLCALDFI